MNWLKKGPELKMPSWLKRGSGSKASGIEVPPFLSDLYYDMRERRLLPLLALAVVAIVAVPFLLGGGSEEQPAASGGGAVAGASGSGMPAFTVVESKPGVRDYHKRFENRSPTDPFKQRYKTAGLGKAQLNEPGEGGGEESGGTITETEITRPAGPGRSGIIFFAWAIDVKITKTVGSDAQGESIGLEVQAGSVAPTAGETPAEKVELAAKKSETTVRHKVLPQTSLPGVKLPVATYMGRSRRGLPLFLVSDQVKSVFGETQCVSGAEVCQLIEVEPKFPVTFVWANEDRYKFTVEDIKLVVTGHAER